MKKIIAILIAMVTVLALAACAAEKPAEQESETEEEENVGMANPWTEAGSAAAAAEGAGVGEFVLPEEGTETAIGPVNFWAFRSMAGLAEAEGGVGAAELTVRKGLTAKIGEDVSGDYTEYAETWTADVDGQEVTCKGNVEDQAMDVLWSAGDYSYCIYVRGQGDDDATFGLGGDDVAALVAAIG